MQSHDHYCAESTIPEPSAGAWQGTCDPHYQAASFVTAADPLVVFAVDDRRHALPLAAVERVVRAAALTDVPHASSLVLGLLNLQGQVLPALDTRAWLGLPSRALCPGDHFIVISSESGRIVLVVDRVEGVRMPGTHKLMAHGNGASRLEGLGGVSMEGADLALVHGMDELRALSLAVGWKAPTSLASRQESATADLGRAVP